MIVPNSGLTIESATRVREGMVPHLCHIADLNYLVFAKVSLEPSIFVVGGGALDSGNPTALRAASPDEFRSAQAITVDRKPWLVSSHRVVFASARGSARWIETVVQGSMPLSAHFDVWSGLQAYEKGRGTPPQTERDVTNHVFDRDRKADATHSPTSRGRMSAATGLGGRARGCAGVPG